MLRITSLSRNDQKVYRLRWTWRCKVPRDLIRVRDGVQAVRHREHHRVGEVLPQHALHQRVRLRVDARRGLVEEQHVTAPHESAREAEALALPDAPILPARAHRRREPAPGLEGFSRA